MQATIKKLENTKACLVEICLGIIKPSYENMRQKEEMVILTYVIPIAILPKEYLIKFCEEGDFIEIESNTRINSINMKNEKIRELAKICKEYLDRNYKLL